MIPSRHTCDGPDVSPPLAWSEVPEGTATLALICDDPDAPMGTWVHWVYYDIPAETSSLPENVAPHEQPPNGGTQGTNDFRKIGYGGPCPPLGTIHHYHFVLYALDQRLNLPTGTKKKQVLDATQGHILSQAEIIGTYRR